MNDLQIFDFGSKQVRTVLINGKIWFVGKDVCIVLGYTDTVNAIKRHCKGVTKHHPINDTLNRVQNVRVIGEPDLFRLIMNSKLSTAVKFEEFVFEEVLPSIRKKGSFDTNQIPNEQNLSAELLLVKSTCDILKANEGSALMMLHSAAKRNGIDPVGLLPSYTEESLTISLTELLKRSGVKMSAVKANKILIEKGIIEVKERPSTKGGVKKFKAFTDDGLRFGKNLINPQNQRETQPHFFDDVNISELLN